MGRQWVREFCTLLDPTFYLVVVPQKGVFGDLGGTGQLPADLDWTWAG